jgi:5-methylcytosine-specific restriction endonuclease McrA
MKNLVPLEALSLEAYAAIVDNKQEPRRTRLRRLVDRVRRLFWAYRENRLELEQLPRTMAYNNGALRRLRMRCSHAKKRTRATAADPASMFDKEESEDLIHCYESTGARNELLARIKELQPRPLRRVCQYCCGVGQASTWDHYVPQKSFPEFSVCPPNLIPACFDCNTRKGDRWIRSGKRIIVNLYYDRINPDWRLIAAEVGIGSNGEPYATFGLVSCPAARTRFGRLFARHWALLGLADRLRGAAESKFDAIGVEIRTWAAHGRASIGEIQQALSSQADGLARTRGAINVNVVLYRAAAASHSLIEYYLSGVRP